MRALHSVATAGSYHLVQLLVQCDRPYSRRHAVRGSARQTYTCLHAFKGTRYRNATFPVAKELTLQSWVYISHENLKNSAKVYPTRSR